MHSAEADPAWAPSAEARQRGRVDARSIVAWADRHGVQCVDLVPEKLT